MTSLCRMVRAELDKTFSRYTDLKAHRDPAPFRSVFESAPANSRKENATSVPATAPAPATATAPKTSIAAEVLDLLGENDNSEAIKKSDVARIDEEITHSPIKPAKNPDVPNVKGDPVARLNEIMAKMKMEEDEERKRKAEEEQKMMAQRIDPLADAFAPPAWQYATTGARYPMPMMGYSGAFPTNPSMMAGVNPMMNPMTNPMMNPMTNPMMNPMTNPMMNHMSNPMMPPMGTTNPMMNMNPMPGYGKLTPITHPEKPVEKVEPAPAPKDEFTDLFEIANNALSSKKQQPVAASKPIDALFENEPLPKVQVWNTEKSSTQFMAAAKSAGTYPAVQPSRVPMDSKPGFSSTTGIAKAPEVKSQPPVKSNSNF